MAGRVGGQETAQLRGFEDIVETTGLSQPQVEMGL